MHNNSSLANYTENPDPSKCTKHEIQQWELLIKFAICISLIILSVVGNTLLMLVIRRVPRFHTPTNYLLFNMSIADILITACNMTFSAHVAIKPDGIRWWGGWSGIVVCKLLIFSQGLSMTCSIFTLVFLAFDRFFAVIFPWRRINTLPVVKVYIAIAWIAAILVVSPMLYAMKVAEYKGLYFCYENWSPLFANKKAKQEYELTYFFLTYTLPLIVISILYSRAIHRVWFRRIPGNVTAANEEIALQSRKKVLKMLMTIVIVFAICWLPLQILRLQAVFSPKAMKCPLPRFVRSLCFYFGFANSALNPAVCFIFNNDYRRGARGLFAHACCRHNYVLPAQRSRARSRAATTNKASIVMTAGL